MMLRGLCAVTADDPLLPRLSALVKAALDGGAPLVQYRNKLAPRPLRRAQAAEMLIGFFERKRAPNEGDSAVIEESI